MAKTQKKAAKAAVPVPSSPDRFRPAAKKAVKMPVAIRVDAPIRPTSVLPARGMRKRGA